jgi:hypothetical protein
METAMRILFPSVLCLGLLAAACHGSNLPVIPTAPAQTPAPAPPAPPIPFAFAERYTPITVGEVVSPLVTADDLPCVGFPEFRCLYFRLTPPSTGSVEAVVTTTRGVAAQLQDVSVADSDGVEWWGPIGGRVSVAVRAGTTYQITVWYAAPGVEFELRTSMRPD